MYKSSIYNKSSKYKDTSFTHYGITGNGIKSDKEIILDELVQPRRFKKGKSGIIEEKTRDELRLAKQKRIDQIKKCIWKGYTKTDLFKEQDSFMVLHVKEHCDHRFCPHSAESMRKAYFKRLSSIVRQYKRPRFATWNFKNVDSLTPEYIKKCSLQFNIARKLLVNEGYSMGDYVNIMEIKLTRKGDRVYHSQKINGKWVKTFIGHAEKTTWHLHYHTIYDGDYIPQEIAAQKLKVATGGESYIVTLEHCGSDQIRSTQKAVSYLCKYITKMHFKSDSIGLVLEYFKATKKMRFVKIVGIKAPPKKKFTYLRSWLSSEGYDYWDVQLMHNDLVQFMLYTSMTKYDLELTEEENFHTYGRKEQIIGSMPELTV